MGAPVVGAKLSNLEAQARAGYVTHVTNVTWDTATAKAGASFVGGNPCK